MTKAELLASLQAVIGEEIENKKLEVLIGSALHFINAYTFQSYQWEAESLPAEIAYAIIELVQFKNQQKSWLKSESLSDSSVSFSEADAPESLKVLLAKYRIYNVV